MSGTKLFRHFILLNLTPGPQGNLCPRFPNKRMSAEMRCLPPRPHSQQGAEPGFEPKASLTLALGPCCARRTKDGDSKSLVSHSERQSACGPEASAREVLGQPSWEPGQTAGQRPRLCSHRQANFTSPRCLRGQRDVGLFVFLGSPCLKS